MKIRTIPKSAIYIIVLFYLNIGSVEVLRFSLDYKILPYVIMSLMIIIITSLVINFRLLNYKYSNIIVIYVGLVFYLLVSALLGQNSGYGLVKIFSGLIFPFLFFTLLNNVIITEKEFIKFLIISILVISVCGIIYKINFGFYTRSIRYGLLGSIPFGWVNGMAFLCTLFYLRRNKKIIIISLFFFIMLLWSGSKGPIVSVLLILIIYRKRIFGNTKINKLLITTMFLPIIVIILNYADDIRSIYGIISFIENPKDYIEGSGSGSVGIRIDFWLKSFNIFQNNLLVGVGFGSWGEIVQGHLYPHNIFLEIASETGIIGLILIVLLITQLYDNSHISIIGTYFLITLMFSGDFTYFRYPLFVFLISKKISFNEIFYTNYRAVS